ncbi:hypothetical protein [Leisingera aquaemixtae]|uniref:hypothetical protein n=1 Tax=Leisingera aquaemixtae TaxID=1396826 RepID=UPI0021A72102|nr:hypothetical protein [Leisingera aquaemixtae]UWQ46860.1 hypothetical protein K3719_05715 [Leisingera aquaemixtae]
MGQEFKVVFERDIPEDVRAEIDKTIRSAVLAKIAELDFVDEISVSRIEGGLGHGQTDGMILK